MISRDRWWITAGRPPGVRHDPQAPAVSAICQDSDAYVLTDDKWKARIGVMSTRRRRTATETVTLDAVDRRLVLTLSRDGRKAAAALAKELGLSRQAVTERIRALERNGVIRGYRADVDPQALGLSVRALIRLSIEGVASLEKGKDVRRRLTANPLVRSVYHVSGEDCFVAEVVCRRIEDVNAILADLQATRAIQSSRTAFVLETVMDKAGLGPLESALIPESPSSK
jgi:Lrp/AsnC family leucine-responsive transcriptional regulator